MNRFPGDDKIDPKHAAPIKGGSVDADDSVPIASLAPAGAAAQMLSAVEFDLPETVGPYRLGRRLGRGTCGLVYLAEDRANNQQVAIKLSAVQKEPEPGLRRFPASHRAFLNEAAAAGRLRHDNIVALLDAGVADEFNYLVTEYVDGETLKAYGKYGRRLADQQILNIGLQCLHALAYSHDTGVVHRDIKPSNIMLAADGQVKILDFGIAVPMGRAQQIKHDGKPSLGTPNYMAPEQVRGEAVSPCTDLYALATVLFELFTGKPLFRAKKVRDLFQAILSDAPPSLIQAREDLPAKLSDVIARALSKDPKERYQSAREFATALSEAGVDKRAPDKPAAEAPGDERVRLMDLADYPLLASLSPKALALLRADAELCTAEVGSLAMNWQHVSSHLLVLDGALVLRRDDIPLFALGCGDLLPPPQASQRQYALQVEALRDSRWLQLPEALISRLPMPDQLILMRAVCSQLGGQLLRFYSTGVDIRLPPL